MLRKRTKRSEIEADEILIDSENLPDFDRDRFEGRIEQPLRLRSFAAAGIFLAVIFAAYLVRAGDLQIIKGALYAKQAQENKLEEQTIIAERGAISDRTGRSLVWSERPVVQAGANENDFARRVYAPYRGIAHALGYAKPPARDSAGVYYRDTYLGVDGAERAFDSALGGVNGRVLTEYDARGEIVSQARRQEPRAGEKVVLSLDAEVTQVLYDAIAARTQESRFVGGAGVIMDVHTGELLAMTSYPEYSPAALTEGDSEKISVYNSDSRRPFLNRATDGLYAPGSIVKPIIAAAALEEGVIDEYKQILSTGSISIPNPYNPETPSVFRDWRAHGYVDMRHAIAVSSDVYFYEVGGGYGAQKGVGIANIDKYLQMFGFGMDAGLEGFSQAQGNIPTPQWKAKTFPDDPVWRIGNTYHTAIGQYGMQITPLQAARAAAALASGKLVVPTLLASRNANIIGAVASTTGESTPLPLSGHSLEVAREGMRMSVREGIATAVNFADLHVAAKTGTAQVGSSNQYMNSWMIGFWPFEYPRFAYAVVLERAPAGTLVGASAAMSGFFNWLRQNKPEYLN